MKRLAHTLLTALLLAGLLYLGARLHIDPTTIIGLATLTTSLSLAIGFALQSLLQGLVAGRILRLERKFRVGDTLTAGGFTGTVVAVQARTTTLHSPELGLIVLPNLVLFSAPYVVKHAATPEKGLGRLIASLIPKERT